MASGGSDAHWLSVLTYTLCVVLAHTCATRWLPQNLKLWGPSVGIFFTTALTRRQGWRVSGLFGILLTVASIAASRSLDSSIPARTRLAQRLCFFPLATTMFGLAIGKHIPSPGTMASTVSLALQIWSLVGGAVMSAVYPASILQVASKREEWHGYSPHGSMQRKYDVHRLLVPSESGVVLDTLIIKQKQSAPCQRWVMFLGGNAQFMEDTWDSMCEIAGELQANAIVYNPRGIGRSTGYVVQVSDLVEDAATVALFAVKRERIDRRRLVFFGHSIGGGIAAQLARHLFPMSSLVIDRSFSSLTDAAKVFSPLTPGITGVLFPIIVGDLNSIEAWNGITHDRKLVVYATDDEVINYRVGSIARLGQFHAPGSRDAKLALELHASRNPGSYHNAPLSAFTGYSAVIAFVEKCFTI